MKYPPDIRKLEGIIMKRAYGLDCQNYNCLRLDKSCNIWLPCPNLLHKPNPNTQIPLFKDSKQIMYSLPTSCMILFFIFYRFHQILCASSEKEIGRCDALFQCGDVTAGFPFSGRNRPEVCGHPLLRLHCINNITSLLISNQEFYVLKINKTSNTLTLARPDLLGSFCSSTFTKFHRKPSSEFSSREKELNMTHLESALREGFEVKVNIDENACQECLSSHAFCGFDQTFPSGVKCGPLYPQDAEDIRRRCSASFSCGDQKDLMYPFWIPGREDCGHPDFKLECNASFAELTISSVKFRILEMNYSSRVIRLSRSDYISYICPLNPVSAPFEENVIPFAPDTEMLTIYYDCRTELTQSVSTYVGEISCHDDVRSYYGICRRNVSIPASRPALDTLERTPTPDNLKKAFEEGFGVVFWGSAVSFFLVGIFYVMWCTKKTSEDLRQHDLKVLIPLKQYSYAQVKIITKPSNPVRYIVSTNRLEIAYVSTTRAAGGKGFEKAMESKLELCETLFECGNITAGFPFWGGTRHRNCGHPLLELLCNKNSSTSIIISDQEYSVFHLNQTSNTIKLTRPDFLGSFCSSVFTNTTLPPQIFELLPTYKNITVFYHCGPFLPYLSSHTCPKIGLISLSENHNGTCRNGFTVNVPTSFIATGKKLNMTNLESVLSKGFEVKLKIDRKACQQCLSTHGSCGFNQTLPLGNKCNQLHPPTKSGGACGNNQTSSRFVCYHNHTSGSGPRMSDVPNRQFSLCQCIDAGLSSGSVVDSGDHGCAAGVIFLAAFITVCLHCQQISHDPGQQNFKTVPQPNIEPYNPLKKYSYAQVTRITKSFAEVVGKGGFGTVYRGTLCDGRIVAVKVLKDSKGNGEDFLTEVATISQTSHVNIVTLLGFCSEDTRGTIGYIAPELFSRMYGRVSHKSDVYSYGMLVLEMIGARNKERAAQNSASDASSIYFPEWIYKDIEKGNTGRLNMDGIVCKEEEMVRKMTLVGLWCIQSSPIDRPPMNRVVEMMEGSVDALKVPPRPGLQIQVAPLQESSTPSENISVYTDKRELDILLENKHKLQQQLRINMIILHQKMKAYSRQSLNASRKHVRQGPTAEI
ncbi:hypothetical protein YC2023_022622 [Brassica napus]